MKAESVRWREFDVFRFKLENGVKDRRQWLPLYHYHKFFFIPSCDWAIWPHIERHISGESFTGQNYPQRPIFGLRRGSKQECGQKMARNLNLHLQFKANLKWAGRQLAAACASQIDQRTIPKSSLTFGMPLLPFTLSQLPFYLIFFYPAWVIMLISGCRLLMEGWVSVITSAIYRSLDWYLDKSGNTLQV